MIWSLTAMRNRPRHPHPVHLHSSLSFLCPNVLRRLHHPASGPPSYDVVEQQQGKRGVSFTSTLRIGYMIRGTGDVQEWTP